METIKWIDKVNNEEILIRVKENITLKKNPKKEVELDWTIIRRK